MPDERQVVVSVGDDRVADMSAVVGALRAAGLRVDAVLDGAGVVTGTVDGTALAGLSAVPGVVEVEQQAPYRVPPPDAPVQ